MPGHWLALAAYRVGIGAWRLRRDRSVQRLQAWSPYGSARNAPVPDPPQCEGRTCSAQRLRACPVRAGPRMGRPMLSWLVRR